MKKITHSDLDSGNISHLKDSTLFVSDGSLNLRMRIVDASYNQNHRDYIEFLPNVLDSTVMRGENSDFNIHLGDRSLRFARLDNNNNILNIDPRNNQIWCNAEFMAEELIKFNSSNAGIQFSDGVQMKRHPVKWILQAERNLDDSAIPFLYGIGSVGVFVEQALEINIVAKVGNEYVSSVIPMAALFDYPAVFPVTKGGNTVATVTFGSAADETFSLTVTGADNVKVYLR